MYPASPWLGFSAALPHPLEILSLFLGGCLFNPGILGSGAADIEGLVVLCQGDHSTILPYLGTSLAHPLDSKGTPPPAVTAKMSPLPSVLWRTELLPG